MNELEKIENDLQSLDQGLDEIQKHLKGALNLKSLDTITDQISLMDQAKLCASNAYCLNSLYFGKKKLHL